MNLDEIEVFKKKDDHSFLESIENFPRQVEAIIKQGESIDFTSLATNIQNITLSGMGGSALGGRIAKAYLVDSLNVPFEIINNYKLPFYINHNSLVILFSYSGTTEETISCYFDAKKRNAKIIVVTTGGLLQELAQKNNDPSIIFDGLDNLSKSPRLGIGYSLSAMLLILSYFCGIGNDVLNKDLISEINTFGNSFDIRNPEVNNQAKQLARVLFNKMINLISAEFLTGVSYSIKNQLNENAKTFSNTFDIPELNHHLLEGLGYPKTNKLYMKFLIIESNLFSEKIQKRLAITKEVIEKNFISYSIFKPKSDTKLKNIFETLYFGIYLSYYLAFLNGINPYPIPWVDYFKKGMEK